MIRNSHRFRYGFGYRLFLSMTILAMLLGSQASSAVASVPTGTVPAPAPAPSNHLMVNVVSATDAASISDFKYIINVDNTGTTTQRSPARMAVTRATQVIRATCDWVSVAGRANNSPIFTQGDQSDFGSRY